MDYHNSLSLVWGTHQQIQFVHNYMVKVVQFVTYMLILKSIMNAEITIHGMVVLTPLNNKKLL